jgi:hypothetical protein
MSRTVADIFSEYPKLEMIEVVGFDDDGTYGLSPDEHILKIKDVNFARDLTTLPGATTENGHVAVEGHYVRGGYNVNKDSFKIKVLKSKSLISKYFIATGLLLILTITGCASPTVAKFGRDTYSISMEDIMGFSSGAELELKAANTAHEYCAKMDKVAQIRNTRSHGNKFWPSSASIIFVCLFENDPYNNRPMYEQPPSIRIENR